MTLPSERALPLCADLYWIVPDPAFKWLCWMELWQGKICTSLSSASLCNNIIPLPKEIAFLWVLNYVAISIHQHWTIDPSSLWQYSDVYHNCWAQANTHRAPCRMITLVYNPIILLIPSLKPPRTLKIDPLQTSLNPHPPPPQESQPERLAQINPKLLNSIWIRSRGGRTDGLPIDWLTECPPKTLHRRHSLQDTMIDPWAPWQFIRGSCCPLFNSDLRTCTTK